MVDAMAGNYRLIRSRLRGRSLRFVPVVRDVQFGGFAGVMSRLDVMSMRRVSVVGGRLVVACLVVLRRFAMMPGRVIVMFCCLIVMFCRLLRHIPSL
jgi:hypothetical protein